MELLDFVRSEKEPIKTLHDRYAIDSKRHEEHTNLVLLKYNQIASPMDKKIVQQCRGIILDEEDNFKVISYPYDKFFNFSEQHAAAIDFSKAKIYEKADGSLMSLYYYDGKWQVSSSGSPSAGGEVNGFKFSFKELFWKTWKELNYSLPTDTGCNYFFELTAPYNRIVVQHDQPDITLHGGRRLSDFRELDPVVEAHTHGWKCVKIFNFEDQAAVLKVLEGMNGSEQEGFVVCEPGPVYKRVKMKCDDYVKKHRLVSSMSLRNMLDLIRTNETDEVLSYCPQFKDLCYDIKTKYEHLVGKIEGFYGAIKHLDDRKQFAARATTQTFSGILFSVKNGKVDSVRAGLAAMDIRHLENWLGIREVE